MAKATITTPQGMQVKVEGTPAEITAVVHDLEQKKEAAKGSNAPQRRKTRPGRASLMDLLESMIDGGFFKKPRDLAAIKGTLAEMGHHYPVTTLSPIMLRLVRRRTLRRIKDQKRWMYVH
jgi:hypothetical protein